MLVSATAEVALLPLSLRTCSKHKSLSCRDILSLLEENKICRSKESFL